MVGRITSQKSIDQRLVMLRRWLRDAAYSVVDRYIEKQTNRQSEYDPEEFVRWQSGGTSCELHVFFLSIRETPEQIERLKNEPVLCDFRPTRSRMAAEVQRVFVSPINGTAAKVSPGD